MASLDRSKDRRAPDVTYENENEIREEIHQLFSLDSNREKFSDFTVVVGGVEFKCHKFILNACSAFFESMFRCDMKERQEMKATVSGISSEIFRLVLSAVYSGSDILRSDNMLKVWKAAHRLLIEFLKIQCEDFVLRSVDDENVFEVYVVAKRLDSDKVLNFLTNYMTDNFSSIAHHEDLVLLQYEDFMRILVKSKHVANVNLQIKAILKWYVPNEDKTRKANERSLNLKQLKNLIFTLNLSKASPDYLAALMTNEFVIEDQELITEINKHAAEVLTGRNSSNRQNGITQEKFGLNKSSLANQLLKPKKICGLFDCLTVVEVREMFSDVIVIVGDEKFCCHKFVLNACSGYFSDLFGTALSENEEQQTATIDGIYPNIFKLTLAFFYTCFNIVGEDNIFEIWRAAHLLRIANLKTRCENFILARISFGNFHVISQQSIALDSPRVLDEVIDYIVRDFKQVVVSDHFMELPLQALLTTLQNKNLVVPTDLKLQAVLRWCGAHGENSETHEDNENLQHLGDLIRIINLELLGTDSLLCLMNNRCIQKNRQALAMVNTYCAKFMLRLFRRNHF